MKRLPIIALIAAAAFLGWRWWTGGGTSWDVVNAPPSRERVVCLGDSLTRGYGVEAAQSYPTTLGQYLGLPEDAVINQGVDGQTTGGGLRDILRAISTNAGTAVVVLGGNDMLTRVPTDEAMRNLEQIVSQLQSAGMMVALGDFSPLPVGQGDWARGYADLARRTGCILIPGIADGLYGERETQAMDRIHLTPAGQREMAARVARAIAPFMGIPMEDVEERIGK